MVKGYPDWTTQKISAMNYTSLGEFVNIPPGPDGKPAWYVMASATPVGVGGTPGYFFWAVVMAASGDPSRWQFAYWDITLAPSYFYHRPILQTVKTFMFKLPGPVFFDVGDMIQIWIYGPLTGVYQGGIFYGRVQ